MGHQPSQTERTKLTVGLPLFDHMVDHAVPAGSATTGGGGEAPSTRRQEKGRTGYHSGLAAEDIVASDYLRRGRTLVKRRYRGEAGEIDLIVAEDDVLVFVEVKHSRTFDRAAHHLSSRQMSRISQTATEFLGTRPLGQLTEMRFDLALVDGIGAVRIIENAIIEGL